MPSWTTAHHNGALKSSLQTKPPSGGAKCSGSTPPGVAKLHAGATLQAGTKHTTGTAPNSSSKQSEPPAPLRATMRFDSMVVATFPPWMHGPLHYHTHSRPATIKGNTCCPSFRCPTGQISDSPCLGKCREGAGNDPQLVY